MKKLKVGILNSSPLQITYGGVAPFMKNLDPFLQKEYEVTYLSLPKFLHDLDFMPRRLTYFIFLIAKMNKICRFDILISHVPEGSYLGSFTKVPLVHIFHGNFNSMNGTRFWYGKYFFKVFDMFEKRILQKAAINYTVGNEQENTKKISNPIYHSVPITNPILRKDFIFVGRLEKIKNVDKIIQVFSKLSPSILKEHSLYIAGYGSEEHYLKEIVKRSKMVDKVIFTGDLPNHELIACLSTKKILFMASKMEGMPMAIAESLSVGVPVISTNTGDIPRVIVDNYNGKLVNVEFNLQEYTDSINVILNNYIKFSENALLSADEFQADKISRHLINDIKETILRKNTKHLKESSK